ncbi:MAG: hypothetical protein ABN488_12765, partial [Methylobacteriaceae bacterium]
MPRTSISSFMPISDALTGFDSLHRAFLEARAARLRQRFLNHAKGLESGVGRLAWHRGTGGA